MKRRKFIASAALTAVASPALPDPPLPIPSPRKPGLSIASYMQRWRQRKPDAPKPGWRNALDVLDHCREIGAGCLQIGVRGWEVDFAGKVRAKREDLGIALEGQIALPRKESALPKFEAEVQAAKEAGATILRTVCLGGRRYEYFNSLDQWVDFVSSSRRALERTEPIVAKHQVKLAVENHKDWRVDEQLELLKHLSSENIGVTFDFGNNLALLENPVVVSEALAPYILSTHLKDMAMAACEDGFLLSEVPLGNGILDLKRIIKTCTDANPSVWFNLEMITRDPLEVPVLKNSYWKTMAQLPAPDLARSLHLASEGDPGTLPRLTGLDSAAQLAFEEANVYASFEHARNSLGFN